LAVPRLRAGACKSMARRKVSHLPACAPATLDEISAEPRKIFQADFIFPELQDRSEFSSILQTLRPRYFSSMVCVLNDDLVRLLSNALSQDRASSPSRSSPKI
jgi:hypothetical protein